MTIPNGPADTAGFGTSNIVQLSLSADIEVDGITFEPGANNYSIATGESSTLTLSGAGIVNNSDKLQTFSVETGPSSVGIIVLSNSASAGSNTSFTNHGGPFSSGIIVLVDSATAASSTVTNVGSTIPFQIGGFLQFSNNSSAENAVLTNKGGTLDDARGGQIGFGDTATAGNATITNEAGPKNSTGNTSGGVTAFSGNSTAGNAIITNKGSATSGGTGGVTFIGGGTGTTDVGNATLIAESGSNGGAGGQIVFMPSSNGGTSRVELFGNGSLSSSQSPVNIGSLEGDGIVSSPITLSVGRNNLSTTFSGLLQSSLHLIKVGKGAFTLTGANTYTAGTVVNSGTLVVANTTGSGTGTGSVQVNGGTLSGSGVIAGMVTLGTGLGRGATLAPAIGQTQESLTIQGALNFKSDGVYQYTFKANADWTRADRVKANGVTIDSGAAFKLRAQATGTLTPGLVITVLSNSAATPISGTFSNLADGAIVRVGSNTLKASYSGGDGNDLTLTVQ